MLFTVRLSLFIKGVEREKRKKEKKKRPSKVHKWYLFPYMSLTDMYLLKYKRDMFSDK